MWPALDRCWRGGARRTQPDAPGDRGPRNSLGRTHPEAVSRLGSPDRCRVVARRMALLAVATSGLLVGCAPKRPASFDYAPDWVSPSMPCSLARSVIESTFKAFHDGEAPPEKYSQCQPFFAALLRYGTPENGCGVGGPRDQAMGEAYIGSRERAEEFKQWIRPCTKVIDEANTYAAALQDYTAKEQSNSFSWRDALLLLAIAGSQ